MREFINDFGKENFIIIAVVILVILMSLILIIAFEKYKASKARKIKIKQMVNNYENKDNDIVLEKKVEIKKSVETKEVEMPKIENTSIDIPKKSRELKYQKYYDKIASAPIEKETKNIVFKKEERNKIDNSETDSEVVYKKNLNPVKEAKEKLEEVTKKLIRDNKEEEHNYFEEEQEEKSIISYDELVKASQDIDEKNDKLLEDEKESAITLEELYAKNRKKTLKNKKSNYKEKVPIISPVFGSHAPRVSKPQKKKVYRKTTTVINPKSNRYSDMDNEAFLKKLKEMRNK